MYKISSVLLSVTLCWHIKAVLGQYQDIPPIPCPAYFQYLSNGITNIGQIKLPNIQMRQNNIEVQLAQRQSLTSNYYGALSFYENEYTTIENLLNGQPISLRLDFPTADVFPILMQISLNGQVICAASAYSAPYTLITLQYSLYFTPRTMQNSPAQSNDLLPMLSKIIHGVQVIFSDNLYTSAPPLPPITPQSGLQPIPSIHQYPVSSAQTHSTPIQSIPEAAKTEVTKTAPSGNLTEICGRESEIHKISPIIHNGVFLRHGEFPWLAAIFKNTNTTLQYQCSGSLISSRTILTAAQCFRIANITADQAIVFLGRQNLSSFSEPHMVSRDIHELLIHPEYNPENYPDADIALLQMAEAVSFTDYIRPICLWDETSDHSFVVGLIAFVAGWGSNIVPKTLQANIIDDAECLREFPYLSAITSSRTLCGKKRDVNGPCLGDSGGGLMIRRNSRWVLRGIVSASTFNQRKCGPADIVIYCDVAKHLTWITNTMLI